MENNIFEDFNIERVAELTENDSCSLQDKIYFDEVRDEEFIERAEIY